MIVRLVGGPADGQLVDLMPGIIALPVDVPRIGGDPEHWDTVYYLTGHYRPDTTTPPTPAMPSWVWRDPEETNATEEPKP